MAVKDDERFTVSSELQSAKAPSPMLVTESGKVISSKELQSEKARSPMVVKDAERFTVSKELQSEKAHSPMVVTESGRVISSKELHRQKARSPIERTVAGICICLMGLVAKQELSILTTPSGIATFSLEHLRKSLRPNEVFIFSIFVRQLI